jgi:hypothetical protein
VNDIAEHDMADFFAVDAGTAQCLAGGPGGQLGGRDIFQAAAETNAG